MRYLKLLSLIVLFSGSVFSPRRVFFFFFFCHGSACPAPFPITGHALTCSHLSLIEHTCNHSPLPFISSLTSVTRGLVTRSQGCMYAALYTGHCLPVCPSVLDLVPPEETQVYVLCDCTSGFQSLLCYISYVGNPA